MSNWYLGNHFERKFKIEILMEMSRLLQGRRGFGMDEFDERPQNHFTKLSLARRYKEKEKKKFGVGIAILM